MGKSGTKRGTTARDDEGDAIKAPATLDGDVLALLHEPVGWEQLKSSWGRQAVLCKSTATRKALFGSYLSSPEQVVEFTKQQPMVYGLDMSMPSDPNTEGEVVDYDVLSQDMAKPGNVIQIHNPQRYHDGLWQLVARLEAALACLVGCTGHVLAAGSPEGDYSMQAESWVCQTRGSRHWKQSAPEEEEKPAAGGKKKGDAKPTLLDITLQAGDVLYIPRGMEFTHDGSEACSFLVLTSHEDWTWGDLAQHMLEACTSGRADPVRLPAQLTASLPPAFFHTLGLAASIAPSSKDKQEGEAGAYELREQQAAQSLAAGLRALADAIEAQPDDLLPPAMDAMAENFVRKRLPPHPSQLAEAGPEPTIDDSLVVRGKGLFMMVPVDGPADPDAPEGFLVVTTPLYNKRITHMMDEDDDDDDPLGSDDDANDDQEDGEDEKEGAEEEEMEEKSESKGKADGKKKQGKAEVAQEDKEKAEEQKKDCCAVPRSCCPSHAKQEQKKQEQQDDDESEDIADMDDDDDDIDDSDSDDGDEQQPLPGPVVPASYALAIAQVLGTTSAPGVPLRDLVALVPHMEEQEALNLAHMLWTEGFACTIKGKPAAAAKKGKKEAAVKKEAAQEPAAKRKK